MTKSCESCRFYSEFDDDFGICYRYPPVFVGAGVTGEIGGHNSSGGYAWDNPTVNSHNWCGEFKPQTVGASNPVAIETKP